MSSTTTPGLVIVDAGDGEPHWIGASRVTVKATRDDTGGAYGLILSEARRGTAPPLHVHHRCDEAIWVISGRLRLRCGEDEFELGPGGFALLPRGVAHGFHALDDVTMLGIVTPGGEEGFFTEAGPVATTAEPPAPDLPRLQRVAARYGDEFVGPPITLD